MYSSITTLLLVLTTLASALPLDPSPQFRHQPTQHTSCIEQSSNYWDSGYRSIFFNHADEPLFNFTITTGYMRFYPATITAWLQEKDFKVVKASTIPKPQLCGWIESNSVMRGGRQHGMVYWKRNNVSGHAVALPTGNSTTKTVPRAGISMLSKPRPNDATFRTIAGILYNNTPDADRYYSMTLMLGIACGTLGFMFVCYGMTAYATMSQKGKTTPKPADVELDQIKVHDLSGSGMQRLKPDGDIDGHKATIETTTTAAANACQKSDTNTCQKSDRTKSVEPLPVYSVDGAAR